jgi:transposase
MTLRRKDGFTTAEKDEVRRLRRENKILREEREILRKYTSIEYKRCRP